jgi:hypothetical protein
MMGVVLTQFTVQVEDKMAFREAAFRKHGADLKKEGGTLVKS